MSGYSELFLAVVELAMAAGAPKPLSKHPGLWRYAFGEWAIALNGHACTVDHIPEFHAMVERHGLPAVLVSPHGGTVVGNASNEDDAIAAVQAETVRVLS